MISSGHATTTDETNLVRQDLVEDLLDLLGAKVSQVSFSETRCEGRGGGRTSCAVEIEAARPTKVDPRSTTAGDTAMLLLEDDDDAKVLARARVGKDRVILAVAIVAVQECRLKLRQQTRPLAPPNRHPARYVDRPATRLSGLRFLAHRKNRGADVPRLQHP